MDSEGMSGRRESDGFGKGIWDAKERNRESRRGLRRGIASQALSPGESVVRPLCPSQRLSRRGLSRWRGGSHTDVNALVRKELDHLPPLGATRPVSPQDRMRN